MSGSEATREQLLALLNAETGRADRWKDVAKRRIAPPRAADGERLYLGQKVEVQGRPGWVIALHIWGDGKPNQVVVKRRNGVMGTWDTSIVRHAPETVDDVLYELLEQANEDEDTEGLVEAFSKRLRLVEE